MKIAREELFDEATKKKTKKYIIVQMDRSGKCLLFDIHTDGFYSLFE